MQHKKLYVVCEIDVQSANGHGDVGDLLRELERPGLTVLSHQVAEGDERSLLAQRPYAISLAASTARWVPFP